jgi:hypothetical protein
MARVFVKTLQWWELRRLFYNFIMLVGGLISFQIAAVSIPLLYIIIGIILNVGYSIVWLIDLNFKKRRRRNLSGLLFVLYLFLSIFFVVGFSLWLLTVSA